MRRPGRRGGAGDETGHRLAAVLPNPLRRLLLGRAADFADHDDAVGVRVGIEHSNDVQVRGAIDGVAADADAGGLADAAAGQLPDRLISQACRCGTRRRCGPGLWM